MVSFNTSILAIALGALAGFTSATTYAQFCDDNACNTNCGESVSVDNPGCLNENNRASVKFHDDNVGGVSLVFSPTPDCPCQNYCINQILGGDPGFYDIGGQCTDISNAPKAQSYRFIGSGCEQDNC